MRVQAVKRFGKTASHVMHQMDNDTNKTHNSSVSWACLSTVATTTCKPSRLCGSLLPNVAIGRLHYDQTLRVI